MLKQVVTSLKIVPVLEAVNVPMFSTLIDAEGKLNPSASMERSAAAMLVELKKWAGPLKGMRAPSA